MKLKHIALGGLFVSITAAASMLASKIVVALTNGDQAEADRLLNILVTFFVSPLVAVNVTLWLANKVMAHFVHKENER